MDHSAARQSRKPLHLKFALIYYVMLKNYVKKTQKHIMGMAELILIDTLRGLAESAHLQSVSRATEELKYALHFYRQT